ncbi:Fumarate reductase [Vibrio crassostreae]|uniref:phage/plasmid replication protein, II/X family n=1 Tax=Vibrio TaxID=662 RepID=UPI00104FF0E3|nr:MULTISPECIES: phage/plasmid replication protein, II/X family [Vibrio]MDP2592936.1 phage/plasmid replication protein, II/X family [Vibrio splendidus]TCT54870.1 II/X family phage/plasmid replication protein [Vibrio crassostreae]TCT74896.1 II/X family phage/plasmid replication protein [Vibrio crassostreae]CAK2172379.1 Fumarate reductase [Vibrio crassostreae]CAK2173083.1 Fumarate reductase [Vibrio crassostreae]
MFFIDQLFMQQDHPEGNLPLVGRHVIERVELETGENLPPTVNQKILEGSFSTKLTIRCNGTRVRVEGNPSRWQRMDNLFGLQKLDECVAIYNHILSSYDLPPFTKNTRFAHRQSADGKSSSLIGNGAEITSIDWTRNLAVGKGKERSFIRGLSSMQIGRGRKPKLYPDGNTCNWGEGSTWIMDKLYAKAVDLQRHLLKDQRKKEGVSQEALDYVNKLIDYCESSGVVREEHSLRQALLKRHDLQFYGITTEQDFHKHLQDIENAMKTIQISHDEHESIAHQLLASGAVDTLRKANTTMSYFTMWQHGADLKGLLKQAQFYEHKARLKAIGIDIGQQFDVSRMCPTLKRSEIIEVQPLAIPPWYKMPVVAETNILPFKAYA